MNIEFSYRLPAFRICQNELLLMHELANINHLIRLLNKYVASRIFSRLYQTQVQLVIDWILQSLILHGNYPQLC